MVRPDTHADPNKLRIWDLIRSTTSWQSSLKEHAIPVKRTRRYKELYSVPSPSNNYRDRVCKTIEMTGFYHTILKCPELGPDIYLTEQVAVTGMTYIHKDEVLLLHRRLDCSAAKLRHLAMTT